MQIRRLDERLAHNLYKRVHSRADADRTKLVVDRQIALLRKAGAREVPAATLRRVKDYAADVFGTVGYYPWLYLYTMYRGEFHEGWVPLDYFRDVALERINGPYRHLCFARTLYHRLLGSDRIPDLMYCVKSRWTLPDGTPVEPSEVRDRVFSHTPKVVVKAEGSATGKGVTIETADSFSPEALAARGNLTVQRYVQQSDVLASIYPGAVTTIRLCTIKPDAAPARAVGAFLRIGSDGARVVDGGAMDVPILGPSGQLGPVATTVDLRRLPRHPDTGFVFKGARLDGYDDAERLCEALHERLPQFGFIGWDATIDDTGRAQVLEMNAGRPGIRFLEMGLGPCLQDLRVERYARHYA